MTSEKKDDRSSDEMSEGPGVVQILWSSLQDTLITWSIIRTLSQCYGSRFSDKADSKLGHEQRYIVNLC